YAHTSFSFVIPRPPGSTLFPYTTLFRSDRAGDLFRFREFHVAHEPIPRFRGRIVHAVGPDIDHHRAGFDHIAGHELGPAHRDDQDRKSTRLNSSHVAISYAVFCLKKKKT